MVKCNNCSKHANFNLPNETNASYHFKNKKENINMDDINHNKCIFRNCMKIPLFNLPNETKALYCSVHKKENMINIKK